MKTILRHTLAAALFCTAFAAGAQNTASGYFLDDYTYRFQLNPAFANSRGFVSFPAVGNINLGLNGNLHLTDFIYNIDGRTTTFMNPGVDAAKFLNGISDVSKFRFNTKIDIFSIGFKGFGGYNTININARANAAFNLPKSLFALMKEGLSNRTYSIGDLGIRTRAYAEIALGHSHDITKEWRIGVTAKALVGGADIDASLRSANLHLGTDAWSITSDAEVRSSLKGLTYETDVNNRTGNRYVSGADVDSPGIGGFGFGLDLGTVYRPAALKDWTFSAAVLDLGFINWDNCMLATTGGPKTFTTDKYTFSFDDTADNSFDNEFDKIGDDLAALYELEDRGDQGKRTTSLAPTINLGAEYKLPLWRKLSFGLLYTSHLDGAYTWHDVRLSANVIALKCFDFAANVSTGTFDTGFGWIINFHVPGFNLFLGMDHTVTKVTKDYVPFKSNAALNFGLNIPIK